MTEFSEEQLTKALEECQVAGNLREGLLRYLLQGIKPGLFLRAVLANDLFIAMGLATEREWDYIYNVLQFLYWNAPGGSWGSKEKVSEFLQTFQQESQNG